MSRSSKKPAVKNVAVDRPFDAAVLDRARRLSKQFRLILEQSAEVGYSGRALEMPECMGTGITADECVRETQELLVSALATMIEAGQATPLPSKQQSRQEQINIRVTADEKLVLEEVARSRGFRGVSDYLRSAGLSAAH